MKDLFEQFLKEKQYLCNLSPKTIDSYRQAFTAFCKYKGELNKTGLKDFVINMREGGLSAGACNVYIRSINSFLTWLQENGYVTEPLRLQQLPQAKVVVKVFTEKHIQALIKFRPSGK